MSAQEKAAPPQQIPNLMKFVLGGVSGCLATCVVQPLDLVKTRMQISAIGSAKKEYNNTMHCIQTIIAKEGPLALYKGIGAGILRQATYTTGRLGSYTYLNDQYKLRYNAEPLLVVRMSMAMLSGAIGAFIGTPAEVALIRMTSDGRLPKEQRRNYTNVANALTRIVKEEGVTTLWRGCLPTVFRAIVVNVAQLSTYSQAKSFFSKKLNMKEGIQLHFLAAMLSGLITTVVSMPVDIAKTRMQNMKMVDGKPEFKGTFDILGKLARQEGILALWKGFTPYYGRLGPHTVLTFIFLERLNQAYYKYVMGTTGGSNL